MAYRCTVCDKIVSDDLKKFVQHTESHIVDFIKQKHPEWAEKNGLCTKCFDYYKNQLKGDPAS